MRCHERPGLSLGLDQAFRQQCNLPAYVFKRAGLRLVDPSTKRTVQVVTVRAGSDRRPDHQAEVQSGADNCRQMKHAVKHTPVLDIYELTGKTNRSDLASEVKKTGQRGLQVSERPWSTRQDGPSALTTAASRKLQALFKKVYGTPTKSNNNCWLRRKLLQGRCPKST